MIRCTVIIVTNWRGKRPEYWRPFIDSLTVEYEGRISHWKGRAIIFVGHVLHTKMKSFVKAMNQKTRFPASATDVCTDHWCEDKKVGLCRFSHKKGERSWMTGIVMKFYTSQRGTHYDWLLKGFWTTAKKKPNYRQIVKKMLPANKMVRCNTLLTIHFPHIYLHFFAAILGDVSDEHSGRFHQEISALDKRPQRKWKLTTTSSLKEKFQICIRENQAEKKILNTQNLSTFFNFSLTVLY